MLENEHLFKDLDDEHNDTQLDMGWCQITCEPYNLTILKQTRKESSKGKTKLRSPH